eukprot:2659234-Prymnesium_polylepis.1
MRLTPPVRIACRTTAAVTPSLRTGWALCLVTVALEGLAAEAVASFFRYFFRTFSTFDRSKECRERASLPSFAVVL